MDQNELLKEVCVDKNFKDQDKQTVVNQIRK